jgi:hypothetical protein
MNLNIDSINIWPLNNKHPPSCRSSSHTPRARGIQEENTSGFAPRMHQSRSNNIEPQTYFSPKSNVAFALKGVVEDEGCEL